MDNTQGSMEISGTNSSRRINTIATEMGAKRYLEIGVNKGQTFNAVEIEERVGVDPKFLFDTSKYVDERTYLYEITSDVYFTKYAKEDFDIIFLDGLHTHQQTFRDFCATFSFSHKKTVWLIDDTFPIDVYSAWPDHQKAVKLRLDAGGQSRAWHGDVFRVVYLIESFFPNLSYCTINTRGNAQTLVWHQPRQAFAPHFDNLSTISSLHYFDALDMKDAFRFVSEEDGISMVLDTLR